MQKSGIWPFACIHSSTRTVPSIAAPSSSPVISRLIEPCGGPSARCCAAAATKAAMPPFMSQAPRPYRMPLRTSPANGSRLPVRRADRDDVGVAGEADVRRSGADAGEQVLDLAVAQRRDGEAELPQGVRQHGLRAGIGRRDRGAADQRLGERKRVVEIGHGCAPSRYVTSPSPCGRGLGEGAHASIAQQFVDRRLRPRLLIHRLHDDRAVQRRPRRPVRQRPPRQRPRHHHRIRPAPGRYGSPRSRDPPPWSRPR